MGVAEQNFHWMPFSWNTNSIGWPQLKRNVKWQLQMKQTCAVVTATRASLSNTFLISSFIWQRPSLSPEYNVSGSVVMMTTSPGTLRNIISNEDALSVTERVDWGQKHRALSGWVCVPLACLLESQSGRENWHIYIPTPRFHRHKLPRDTRNYLSVAAI